MTKTKLKKTMKKTMKKALCQWSGKEIRNHREIVAELVRSPAFLCEKCGRASSEMRMLCLPTDLE